jgi:copper chaperone NosL
MRKISICTMAVIIAAALAGCSKGPEPIRWGMDMCDHCRMILSDKRFGAELVANRVYKFDGIDELARFQASNPEKKGDAYVTDGVTGKLVPAAQAVFLRSAELSAPMGGHVMSFATTKEAEEFVAQHRLHDVLLVPLAAALAEGKGGGDAGH